MHTLTIPMRAIGKARARVYGRRAVTPPATAEAEKRIAAEWVAAGLPRMIDGPLALHVEAVYAMPASWSRLKRAAGVGRPMRSVPDVDNLAKLALDALNGVAYPDDQHITDLGVSKIWGEADSLTIRIGPAFGREAAHV